MRYAMLRGALTGSADGKPVAPLMGAFKGYDGGSTFVHVGPASFFLAYPDHGIVYRFFGTHIDEVVPKPILAHTECQQMAVNVASLTFMVDPGDRSAVDQFLCGSDLSPKAFQCFGFTVEVMDTVWVEQALTVRADHAGRFKRT